MKKILSIIFVIAYITNTYAQIGVNADNTAPHSSAMLDVKSTTKAFYPPRMTTVQKNAIVSPQVGAVVYDTNLGVLSFYNGTEWVAASGSGGSFTLPISKTGSGTFPMFSIENLNAIGDGFGIRSTINSDQGSALAAYASKASATGITMALAGYNSAANALGYGVLGNHSGSGIGVYGNASNNGIGVKGVSQNGIGGFFSGGTTSSYALVTDVGNVGIGTSTPTLAGLVVNKVVGNSHVIFGSNTAGVSIESNWPGISFNSYYNVGRKPLSNGYVGGLSMNPINGSLLLYNSVAAGTTGTNILTAERMVINNLGNVGIGISTPASKLDIQGSTNLSHFYYGSNEDTYIRGGKATSNVIIGDVGNNIGVKTAFPFYDLTFKSELGDKISFWGGETSTTTNHYGIGMQGGQLQFFVPTNSDNLVFGTGRSESFIERMRINGGGNVGIGTNNPLNKLQVNTTGNSSGIVHQNNVGISVGTYIGFNAGWYGTFSNHPLSFFVNNGNPAVTLTTTEQLQVGGTATPAGFKMSVDGKLICTELEVKITPWPDYVFGKNYKLKPLPELESFIEKNGHLPNIPKAETIENQSLALGNMSKLQMEKIEELTLYVIEINKRLQKVEEENTNLKTELKNQKTKTN